jgi:hypothetical protein
MRKLFIISLIIIGFDAIAYAEECSSQLFYIEKSTNKNIVVYEANVDEGKINQDNPLDIYWSRANSTSQGALSWLEEKFAYGVRYINERRKDKFYITSVPEQVLELKVEEGSCPKVVTEIDDQEVVMSKVYVNVTGTGLSTDVNYIEIEGVNPETHKTVVARISN